MERGAHAWLKMVLYTLLGRDHSTAQAMRDIKEEILKRETNLEEYNPQERGSKGHLPESITLWVHIWLSDWFARQWERWVRETFPDLTEFWRNMDLQETWEPPPPSLPSWLQGGGEGVCKEQQTDQRGAPDTGLLWWCRRRQYSPPPRGGGGAGGEGGATLG